MRVEVPGARTFIVFVGMPGVAPVSVRGLTQMGVIEVQTA
jgi:NCAIR mutase (PurE)-related protein